MGRFWLGVGILAGLFVLGIWVAQQTETTHTQIVGYLEQATKTESPAQRYLLAEKAEEKWRAGRRSIAAVSDHAPMDEIDSLFAQMDICRSAGLMESFSIFCARTAEQIRALYEAHSLTWWNLL